MSNNIETFESIKEEVTKNPHYLRDIIFKNHKLSDDQLYELHLIAVNNKSYNFIEYIDFDKFNDDQKYKICIESITQSGYNIQYILKNDKLKFNNSKYYNLCFNAVNQPDDKRHADYQIALIYVLRTDIKFTDIEFYNICIASVKQTKLAIHHIITSEKLNFENDQWYNIYLNAININSYAIYQITVHNKIDLSNTQYYNLALAAVDQNGLEIQNITNFDERGFTLEQSYNLFDHAVKQDAKSILLVMRIINNNDLKIEDSKIYDLCLRAIKRVGYLIYFTTEKKYKIKQTKELCLAAVESIQSCDIDGFISIKTHNYNKGNWLELPVKKVYFALQFIEKKFLTYEVCMAAVKKYGISIQFIKFYKLDLSKDEKQDIRIEAIKENPDALEFIIKTNDINDSEKVKLCSTMIDIHTMTDSVLKILLKLSTKKAHNLCKQAVTKDWKNLKYIQFKSLGFDYNQIHSLCEIAYKKNPDSTKYMPKQHKLEYEKSDPR